MLPSARVRRARRMVWLRQAADDAVERATLDPTRAHLIDRGWERVRAERLCVHGVIGEQWRIAPPDAEPRAVWMPVRLCTYCSWPGTSLLIAQRAVAQVERRFLLAFLADLLPAAGPWNIGLPRKTGT